MAIYPGATVELIDRYKPGGGAGGDMFTTGRLIFHTAVSSSSDLHDFFNTPGQALAHFYITGDGHVFQYVDTSRRASAILEGNYDGITVETEDIGSPWWKPWAGSNVPTWTDAQVQALAELAVWCHQTHGIPLKALLTSRAGHKGIGTHRLGCPGNFPATGILHGMRSGDEKWTTSPGKVCPGDRRISQTYNEVLPLAQELAATPAPVAPKAPVGPGHVDVALREIRRSIKATKPDSPLRKVLRPLAKQLRQVISKRPHEDSNRGK